MATDSKTEVYLFNLAMGEQFFIKIFFFFLNQNNIWKLEQY